MIMIDEDIVRKLAPRLGLTEVVPGFWWEWPNGKQELTDTLVRVFTSSRDALQPVLEKMTPEEWLQLWRVLCDRMLDNYIPDLPLDCTVRTRELTELVRYLELMPPRQLAQAIAEVIQ